ncbi:hypothetical protein ABZ499_32985 [Streptomyces sp. NPDC019990]|uniref:hypothetical protein n=1 Tax=Streptomyces sp. NPDC019990 TaxID=3154693 RepID=UPI00340FE61E
MSHEMYDEFASAGSEIRDAMLAVAERLERDRPDDPAVLSVVLDIAQAVTEDLDQAVLGGMLAFFLIPEAGETRRQHAARLREGVGG